MSIKHILSSRATSGFSTLYVAPYANTTSGLFVLDITNPNVLAMEVNDFDTSKLFVDLQYDPNSERVYGIETTNNDVYDWSGGALYDQNVFDASGANPACVFDTNDRFGVDGQNGLLIVTRRIQLSATNDRKIFGLDADGKTDTFYGFWNVSSGVGIYSALSQVCMFPDAQGFGWGTGDANSVVMYDDSGVPPTTSISHISTALPYDKPTSLFFDRVNSYAYIGEFDDSEYTIIGPVTSSTLGSNQDTLTGIKPYRFQDGPLVGYDIGTEGGFTYQVAINNTDEYLYVCPITPTTPSFGTLGTGLDPATVGLGSFVDRASVQLCIAVDGNTETAYVVTSSDGAGATSGTYIASLDISVDPPTVKDVIQLTTSDTKIWNIALAK